MTWDDVRSFLFSSMEIRVVRDETDRLAIDVGSQRIVLESARAFEEPWLVAVSPIVAQEEVVRPIDALEMNGKFAAGALAIVDEVLVFRWAAGLARLDPPTLRRTLEFIGREGARLVAIHGRVTSAVLAVKHFAD